MDPRGGRLLVNAEEAERVRAIFKLYLEHEALLPVVQELERRGWTNKRWQTRKGHERGGQSFTKTSLHRLLTNVGYVGKVKYRDEVHDGEHSAIVDAVVFRQVQTLLRQHGGNGDSPAGNQFGFLLRGILRCGSCGCSMTPSQTARKARRYRYYTCTNAQKRGWDKCQSKSIPAGQIEQFVVSQLRCVGRDETLLGEVLAQARAQDEARTAELDVEQRALEKDLGMWHAEISKLTAQMRPGEDNGVLIARLADLQERIARVEERVRKVREQIRAAHRQLLDDEEAETALSLFDPVWGALTLAEQAKVVRLLVKQVQYDGQEGTLAITFHATGIKTLADELARRQEEKIA
jgi:site-specific DNA recombinase